jgi:hypothetical protein
MPMFKSAGRISVHRSLILLLLVFCAAGLSAQPFDPFLPANPIVMGRGGSFTATASGYNSFFFNPAGFAREGEFTLASVNAWAFMNNELVDYALDAARGALPFLPGGSAATAPVAREVDPDAFADLEQYFTDLADWAEGAAGAGADLEAIVQDALGDPTIEITDPSDLSEIIAAAGTEDVVAFLNDIEAAAAAAGYPLPFSVADLEAALASGLPSGYLRAGGMAGIGYVGNGIGLGLFLNTEATVDATNILQATGTAFNTITFVGGFGLTFGNLNLGVAIRPTIFGYTSVAAASLVADYLTGASLDLGSIFNESVFFGSGLGIDLGAVYTLGPFSFGASVKDFLGTRIAYRKSSFDEYFQALSAASLPLGSELTVEEASSAWTIPMKVNLGAEFHPDLRVISFLIDPRISVDLLDVSLALRTAQSGEEITSDVLLSMLNFGAEIETLRFLTVRGGYYGGYLSAGLGLDLVVVDINAALAGDFGRDDAGQWGFTNVGGSVEFAIRF